VSSEIVQQMFWVEDHQKRVPEELQGHLDEPRKQVVDYYLPMVVETPPDSMLGQLLYPEPTLDDAQSWLDAELDRVFPKAEGLIQKMQLDVRYKDVTFEILNQEDFLESIKGAFPRVDWEKAYEEFRAAGEKQG